MAAILSVYREGVLHCQVEVAPQGIRIGRGPENDLVLEDAQKRVSRFHAELRWEGDRIILSDLHSANGTLVNGARVDTIELPANLPALIGPYRMLWEEGALGEGSESHAAPPPSGVSGGISEASHAESAAETTARTSNGPMRLWRQYQKPLLYGGLPACALLAVIGLWVVSEPTPVADPPGTVVPVGPTCEELVRDATQLLQEKTVESARNALEHAERALARCPSDSAAQQVKDAAEKVIAADATFNGHLNSARELLGNGDASGALEQAEAALAMRPDHPEAQDLRRQAEELQKGGNTKDLLAEGWKFYRKGDLRSLERAIAAARAVLSAEPGNAEARKLLRAANEARKKLNDEQPPPPVDDLAARYSDAESKVRSGSWTQAAEAIPVLDEIRRDRPEYRPTDVATLIAQAREMRRTAAQNAYDEGTTKDAGGDLVGALRDFERARAIHADVVPGLDLKISETRRKKVEKGEKALSNGRNYYNAKKPAGWMALARTELEVARRHLDEGTEKHGEAIKLLAALGAQ